MLTTQFVCLKEPVHRSEFGSLKLIRFPLLRVLPTETKVESGTSQSKSGTSDNLNKSGAQGWLWDAQDAWLAHLSSSQHPYLLHNTSIHTNS